MEAWYVDLAYVLGGAIAGWLAEFVRGRKNSTKRRN